MEMVLGLRNHAGPMSWSDQPRRRSGSCDNVTVGVPVHIATGCVEQAATGIPVHIATGRVVQTDASQPAGDGIRRLLGSFTRVRGLVFGQYGEWSLDVSHLISISAARAAARGWRQTGFRSEAEYRGMLTGMLRRRVGLQVVRAFARQRLRRVGLVGIPRTEIDGWRERQQRDRTLGSRGSDALVRLSDVLAYAAEYRAHTPHGVMP